MKKKVLLLGSCGAGKTSMRSIVFASYIAQDTKRLQATIEIEHSHVKFLGDLVLNLWDCGGQERFMENYFTSQKQNIFTNVEVLIYVFDVERRDEDLKNDYDTYNKCLNAMYEFSPAAQVFCLIHKMDLIQEDQKERIFLERQNELHNISTPMKITCFKTSIWDETLFKAWSSIVYELIPNVEEVEQCLKRFADLIECDEVLLFERATFLIISGYERVPQRDPNRIEKVSNIIKRFKISCSKLATMFSSMEIRSSTFAVFLDSFTSNTYVMVVTSDTKIQTAAIQMNIKHAMKRFQALDRPNQNPTQTVSISRQL